MQRNLILALAVSGALALSACGRDGGPDTSEGGIIQEHPTDGAAAGTPQQGTGDTGTAGSGDAGTTGTGVAATGAGSTGAADTSAVAGGSAQGAADAGVPAPQQHPEARRTCLEEVARASGTPVSELVVTGTQRTDAGVDVRVQRQELSSAWRCQTDAQGTTVLGVQDGGAA